MKRRSSPAENASPAADRIPVDPVDALCAAFAALESAADVRAFLVDLCTPAELEAMADRWRVVPLLLEGVPYREIHDRTAVSVTTVGRVARCIEFGAGGYRRAALACGIDPQGPAEPAR